MEFYCKSLDCKMDESTCLQNRLNNSMKNCKSDCKIFQEEAAKQLYNLLLSKIKDSEKIILGNDYSICLSFHKHLNFEIYFYGFKDEAYVEVDCGRYGSTHFHPDGSEVLDDITKYINGSHVIVSKFWCHISVIIEKEVLKKHPLINLFGVGVKIITKDGCFSKKQFLNEIKAQG